jgi:hypothetical protein
MRSIARAFFLLLAGLGLTGGAWSSDLTFRVYGGLGYADGGDLSRSLAGWRSYYQGRQGGGFSSTYGLGEMHRAAELGAEVILALSPRWSLSLGVGYVYQSTSGSITTETARREETPGSGFGPGTIDFGQTTEQNPDYAASTIPITLSLDYSLRLNPKWKLMLGGGGGVYFGRLDLRESYSALSESLSEEPTANGIVQFVDRLSTDGDYSEKTKGTGFGVHGRVGVELELSPSSFLSITVLGRWVEMRDWKGTRQDASEWQWEYGLWGANSAEGTDERTEEGEYWTYDLSDENTGGSYSVLVFRQAAPSPSSRPARLNLSGFSVRVGLGFRFGGGD